MNSARKSPIRRALAVGGAYQEPTSPLLQSLSLLLGGCRSSASFTLRSLPLIPG
jgi:hypothetical protein